MPIEEHHELEFIYTGREIRDKIQNAIDEINDKLKKISVDDKLTVVPVADIDTYIMDLRKTKATFEEARDHLFDNDRYWLKPYQVKRLDDLFKNMEF